MFIPEDEDITPLVQAQEANDGVYVLIQEKDGRFYALKTDGKYDGRLTTNVEEVTSYITSNEDGLLTLDISNMEGRASLLRIDRMEGEAVRIKDVATNLFISGNDNGNGLRNDRITTWLISPTGENDGSVLISSNGGRRWSVNTNELTWTSTTSQLEAYTSGATYLFKTGYNSPIANGITFVTEIVQPSDTLPAPAIDITPYVNELFIEWEKVENATSYILKIPEINLSETLPSNIQSYSIGGLEPSHRYRIELQALSDNPELHNSTTVTTYAPALASKDNNLVIKDITTEGITISVPEAVKNPTLHLLRHKQQTENTADDIFISKYFHGAAFTRMLSVYNGTGKDVPLGNIRIIGGKNSWSDSISLDNMGNIHCGHIAPGEEITVCLYSPSSVYDKRVISMVTDSALRKWFCVTGGMPQAVAKLIETNNYEEVDRIKRSIISLYRDDISKAKPHLVEKIRSVFDLIPSELNRHEKKFRLSDIRSGARNSDYREAFLWLEDAKLVNMCYRATEPNIGLRMNKDSESYKCYFADTGLLLSMAFDENELASDGIMRKLAMNKLEVNKGMLIENVIAQMLAATGRKLYFFSSYSRISDDRMEVDFLIAKSKITARHNISPIEVKSSANYTLCSLSKYRRKYAEYINQPYVIHTSDYMEKDGVIYLPIYMTLFL